MIQDIMPPVARTYANEPVQRLPKADAAFAKKMEQQHIQREQRPAEKKLPDAPQLQRMLKKKLPQSENQEAKKDVLADKPDVQQLLLAVSEQGVALEQLKASPEILQQLTDMLQSLPQDMPLQHIPQLQEYLQEQGIAAITEPNQTVAQLLHKLTAEGNGPVVELAVLPGAPAEEQLKETEEKTIETAAAVKDEHTETPLLHTAGEIGVHTKVSEDGVRTEKVPVAELGHKLQEKVEELQKFVVRNERIYMQLDPDRFGTLHVFMRKQGDHIHIHVEGQKDEIKKQVEVLFEDLKQRLKEKDIDIQMSYTEREGKQEQREERRPSAQPQSAQDGISNDSGDFTALLEGLSDGN